MEYSYIKPLKDVGLIDEFQRKAHMSLPSDFVQFIQAYNGSRPGIQEFKTECRNRCIKTFLSFNRDDKENVWSALDASTMFEAYKIAPIAVDSFGNYICIDRIGVVIFIDHETFRIEYITDSFANFLNLLGGTDG